MKDKVEKIFFALLRFEIDGMELCDDVKNLITDDLLPLLFKLSKIHDLAHLIGDALDKNGLLVDGSNAKKFFIKERNLAIFRYERIQYEYDLIVRALEQFGIKFVPLKGSIIRKYYPEPWMRTSCDIDILVKESELDNIAKKLCDTLGYSCENQKTVNELSLFSSSGVHLELHYDLTEGDKYGKNILSNIWDYAVQKEGCNECELIDPIFYFYHIAHMAKHFRGGGCGIRSFLDLKVLQKRFKYNREIVDQLLVEWGLKQFEEYAIRLADCWASGVKDENLSVMEKYIFYGGIYGVMEQHVAARKGKDTAAQYIRKRIFMPYEELKKRYKILEKHKWLTPIFEIGRWFSVFNPQRSKQAIKELEKLQTMDIEKQREITQMFSNLGL